MKSLFSLLAMLTFMVGFAALGWAQEGTYTLDAGDKIRLTVFGEEELSGEFEVDGAGGLALPLIGVVEARGENVRALEQKITAQLSEGYLVNPRVNIEVLNFRPFFILGEVNQPGSYPYVSGITALNAVAMAGGYTYRARKGRVMVKRGGNSDEIELQEDEVIQPGDIIRVTERFF